MPKQNGTPASKKLDSECGEKLKMAPVPLNSSSPALSNGKVFKKYILIPSFDLCSFYVFTVFLK